MPLGRRDVVGRGREGDVLARVLAVARGEVGDLDVVLEAGLAQDVDVVVAVQHDVDEVRARRARSRRGRAGSSRSLWKGVGVLTLTSCARCPLVPVGTARERDLQVRAAGRSRTGGTPAR